MIRNENELNYSTGRFNDIMPIKKGINIPFISKKKTLLIGIIISVIILILIIILCVKYVKKKERSKGSNITKEKETEKENIIYNNNIISNYNAQKDKSAYIIGTYRTKKGIPLKIFNPSRIGLSYKNYTIDEININNTRRL